MPPRFSWDYLPLEGNSISDQRGMRAPQVRVRLAAPLRDKDTDPASVKYAVEDKYRNVTQQALHAFRQNMALGSVQLSYQKRQLPDGTLVEYANHGGQEFITITVSASALSKLEKAGISMPCLMILYDGNQVAAIPMPWLKRAIGKQGIEFKKKLKKSSWGNLVKCIQMPCNDGTIAVTQFNYANSRIIGGSYRACSTFKDLAFKKTVEIPNLPDPLLAACDGNRLHIDGGNFTTMRASVSGSPSPPSETVQPFAVSIDGERSYGFKITAEYTQGNDFNVDTYHNSALTPQQENIFDDQYSAAISGDALYVHAYSRYGKGGEVPSKFATNGGTPDAWVTIDSDLSLAMPIQIGSKTEMGAELVQIEASSVVETDYTQATIFGKTIRADKGNPFEDWGIICFPPAISANEGYIYDRQNNMLTTPYGTEAGESFNGWMHISNGEHLIQGYVLDGNRKLYLNGQRYDEALKSMLKDCNEINGLMMNVPLRLIKSLT